MISDIIKTIRQPDHTGDNRCYPCTVVNIVIAIVLSTIISGKSKVGGISILGISTMFIYLRGYLVPGTPSLTKQYLPKAVLQLFGKNPKSDFYNSVGTNTTTNIEPTDSSIPNSTEQDSEIEHKLTTEQYLLEQNVVEFCEEIEDLCLTTEFETTWLDEISAINTDTIGVNDANTLFGINTNNNNNNNMEIVKFGNARVVKQGDTQIGKWPSDAALIADIAAARVLDQRDSNWNRYSPEQKGKFLSSIRLFLEVCPTDGGSVSITKNTVESCCQSHEIFAVTCDDTGERLFEIPVEDVEL